MFKDILGQAWEAMLYNRRRTMITMIGMAWGIATVVLLLAYGAGFARAFEAIFAEWGTHTIGVFPGRTSQQAGGDKAGVRVRFTLDDVDRVAASVPGIGQISPAAYKDVTVQNDLHTYTWSVLGARPIPGHSEAGTRSGALFQRGRGPAARPCLRDRLGGEDQAVLRRLGAGGKHSPERRDVHHRRCSQPQDAGGRGRHHTPDLHPLQHDET